MQKEQQHFEFLAVHFCGEQTGKRGAGHEACVGEGGPQGKYYLEDLDVDGNIILK